MKKTLVATFFAFTLPVAAEEDARWFYLSETDEATVSILKDSYEHKVNLNSVVAKLVTKNDKSVEVFNWSVSDEACEKGLGVIKGTNMSGDEVMSNDFAFGAGNLAAISAEFICSVSDEVKKAKS